MPWRPSGRRRLDRHVGAQRIRWPAARRRPAAARSAAGAGPAQDTRSMPWRPTGRRRRHAVAQRTRWPAAARSAHGQVGADGADTPPGKRRARCRGGRQAGAGLIATRARSAPGGQRVDVGQLHRAARTARSAPPAQIQHQGKRGREAVAAAMPAPAIATWASSAPGGQLLDVGQLQRVARTARSTPPAQDRPWCDFLK